MKTRPLWRRDLAGLLILPKPRACDVAVVIPRSDQSIEEVDVIQQGQVFKRLQHQCPPEFASRHWAPVMRPIERLALD